MPVRNRSTEIRFPKPSQMNLPKRSNFNVYCCWLHSFRRCLSMSKLRRLSALAVTVASLVSAQALGQSGVTTSTKNPQQIATLHWYKANQTTKVNVGNLPAGAAFDGANLWVANAIDNTVTKLRTNDGAVLGTFAVG